MNPAALSALLSGDFENAKVALTPGGIEAQEKAGQMAFVANETLPVECNCGTREQLEAIGIVYGDPIDDLFVSVCLPDGWQKATTGHSMWSDLLDEKGRKRASIFYKAAFYDRRAFIDICRRFKTTVEPVTGWADPEYRNAEQHCVVYDGENAIWHSDPIPAQPDEPREARLAWYDQKNELVQTGIAWLDEHYPDWRDPVAYWD